MLNVAPGHNSFGLMRRPPNSTRNFSAASKITTWSASNHCTQSCIGKQRDSYQPNSVSSARKTKLSGDIKETIDNYSNLPFNRLIMGLHISQGNCSTPCSSLLGHRTLKEVVDDLQPGTTLLDLFTALFPCGSVTGAPKVTAMRQIARLENTPRQVYCGAIGWLSPENETIFNVAIRTALLDRATGKVSYGVGGGIVWDSTAEEEYQEALAKATILTEMQAGPEFELLETLCLENGQYTLRERHIQRLLDSAYHFVIPCDRETVIRRLETVAQSLPEGSWRVRLLVAQDGSVRTEYQVLAPLPDKPLLVALGKTPMDSTNRFLYHKTTYRAFYQEQRDPFPDMFDVLLWNERGEITEFTTGNVVFEIAGQCWTPPLESGLLAGTLRAEMLATNKIKERVLPISDLARIERLWFLNSVRGWIPVHLMPVASPEAGCEP